MTQPLARTLGLWALVCAVPISAQITVVSVSPARNATAADTAASIAITFATTIDAATVTPQSVRVYGRWSGVAHGTLSVDGTTRTIRFEPARPFFAGEMVTVMLSSAVRSVGGNALLRGYTWSYWTQPRRGTRTFQLAANIPIRQSGEGLIQTYGAYAGDLDRDGSPDLSLPNETSADVRVLRNDGCGTFGPFTIYPLTRGGKPSTNEGQDYNSDGWIDLAVGNINANSVSILMGDGLGGYLPAVHYPSGSGTRGLAVLDLEADGDVDIVTANRVSSNLAIHRNTGNGTFAPSTLFEGGGQFETAVAAGDANNDGVADLWVGCYGSRTITLLLGDGAGSFTLAATAPVTGQPWMIVVADFDRDGNLDAATSNSTGDNVAIVRGNGAGGLLPASHANVGTFPLAIDAGDLDGDGAHDLVASNYASSSFTVLWNNGTGGFGSPLTLNAPRAGSCALLVDYDRDGDLDVIGVDEVDDRALLFRQTNAALPNVQAASCGATLRIDEHAGSAGYGGSLARAVGAGRTMFLGVTGGATQPFGVLAGVAAEPGFPTAFGLFNLAGAPLLALPGGVLNAFGEAMVSLPLPAGLPSGARLAIQGATVNPALPAGVGLTNPETAEVR